MESEHYCQVSTAQGNKIRHSIHVSYRQLFVSEICSLSFTSCSNKLCNRVRKIHWNCHNPPPKSHRIPYWMPCTARASYEKRWSRSRWHWRSLLLYHAVWSGTYLPTLQSILLSCESRSLIWNASTLTTNYTASPILLLLHTNVSLNGMDSVRSKCTVLSFFLKSLHKNMNWKLIKPNICARKTFTDIRNANWTQSNVANCINRR
jgi:hypothetical protein